MSDDQSKAEGNAEKLVTEQQEMKPRTTGEIKQQPPKLEFPSKDIDKQQGEQPTPPANPQQPEKPTPPKKD